MTAYLAFGALKGRSLALGQTIRVSERAWHASGSRMFIEPRKPVTVEELLHGLIIQSGNDASIALAEAVAGSEPAFVERMNREAGRLGMTDTNFTNSSGCPARALFDRQRLGAYHLGLDREYPSTISCIRNANTATTTSHSATATSSCGSTRTWTV